jgi:hypothetical protein
MQTGACGLTAAAASGCAAGGAPRPAASTDSLQDSPRPPRSSLHPWSLGAASSRCVFFDQAASRQICAWREERERERERRGEQGNRTV